MIIPLRSILRGCLLAVAVPAAALAQTTNFAFTGGTQTYTVPAGVTLIQVTATGAAGGRHTDLTTGFAVGAQVQAALTVVPGEVLTVVVGGQGTSGADSNAGGYNGGGTGNGAGGGGGGATDLRRASATGDYLRSRNALLVAGGAGGADGFGAVAGAGGTPTGGAGAETGVGVSGAGATQAGPGAGGVGAVNNQGGNGNSTGGGAGGYYGGNGGTISTISTAGTGAAGGGGGSSWADPGSLVGGVTYTAAPTVANGALTILANPPVITAFSPVPGGLGQLVTITGLNLSGVTSLLVNGVSATASIANNTATGLTFRVPVSAPATGTTTLTAANGTTISTAFTVMAAPGNALAFDGANDYVRVPDNNTLDFGAGDFTVEAWVYKGANSSGYSNSTVAGKWNTGATAGTNEWLLQTTGNGGDNLPSFWVESGNDIYKCIGAQPLTLNRWYHLAGVRQGGSLLLYVNGVQQATQALPAAAAINNVTGRDLLLGNFAGNGTATYYTNERLDELRIWNSARTAAQLLAGITTVQPASTAGLVAYYNFDAGTPAGNNAGLTTLYDLTANANHGTLTNFALTGTASNWVESYAMVVPAATAATSIGATGFTATWTAPALGTVNNYVVDVATTLNFASPVAGSPFTVAAPATSLNVTGLTRSSTYYYRVRALKAGLTDGGAYSGTITVATPLPVELTAFTATLVDGRGVRLAWATATEKNSASFEVERSLDGRGFARVGTVAAAGTSSQAHRYELLDAQLPATAAALYYRLRQVDVDGMFSYSPVRAVTLGKAPAEVGLALLPNPAHGAATLTGAVPGTVVTVFDALGRVVASAPADAAGTAALVLPAGLSTGVYVVRAGAKAVRLVVE